MSQGNASILRDRGWTVDETGLVGVCKWTVGTAYCSDEHLQILVDSKLTRQQAEKIDVQKLLDSRTVTTDTDTDQKPGNDLEREGEE